LRRQWAQVGYLLAAQSRLFTWKSIVDAQHAA
jgi:hypothetical protein